MMTLEEHDRDVFVGVGPPVPVGRALRRADRGPGACGRRRPPSTSSSASTRCTPTSSDGGDHAEPIRFEVDRQRNGRSFVTRRVVARQAVGRDPHDVDVVPRRRGRPRRPDRHPARACPAPSEVAGESWSPMFERRFTTPAGLGARPGHRVDADDRSRSATIRSSRPAPWPTCPTTFRPTPSSACTPTCEAPRTTTSSTRASCRRASTTPSGSTARRWPTCGTCTTSPATATCRAAGSGIGHVLTADGVHVATVAQEVLLAEARPPLRFRRWRRRTRPASSTSSSRPASSRPS